MTTIIDGRKIAQKILIPVKREILNLKQKNIKPSLAIILVGDDPESSIYVREKEKKAAELSIQTKLFKLPKDATQSEVESLIKKLNQDNKISGILIQLPLPKKLDTDAIIDCLNKQKDVDGLTTNSPFSGPCVSAILKIVETYKIELKDKKIVIMGIGRLVGKPLCRLLQKRNLDVELISSRNSDFSQKARAADILICASKNKNIICPDLVKKNAVVIDVACNVEKEVAIRASYITPQIGGVGPVTVAILLQNVVLAANGA